MRLLWVYEKVFNPMEGRGEYAFQTAIYVRKGAVSAGRKKADAVTARAGSWLILHQGARWQKIGGSCEVLSVGFHFQFPTGEPLYDEGLPVVLPAAKCARLTEASGKLHRVVKQTIGLGYATWEREVGLREYVLSQEAFANFLLRLAEALLERGVGARVRRSEHPAVEESLRLLDHWPEGSAVRVREVATQVGLSGSRLDQLLVQATGKTLHAHAEMRRLQRAREALLNDRVSLKQIAYRLGFANPSHFSNWFKARMKIAPGLFRERELGKADKEREAFR